MSSFSRDITQGAPWISAAPAGGPYGGRGCALILALAAGIIGAGSDASGQIIDVPSGLNVTYFDHVFDGGSDRYRFVAPEIGPEGKSFDQVADDMAYLCDKFILPQLTIQGENPDHIVVTLMQEPVEFGVMNPDVYQFFESYNIQDGLCIWELF